LETDFKTARGTARVTDLMPVGQENSSVIRLVTGLTGRVAMELDLVIRFDYGQAIPWFTAVGEGTYTAIAGPDMLTLRSGVPVHGEGMRTVARFTVTADETVSFVLTNSRSYHPLPKPLNVRRAIAATETFWRDWSHRCHDAGPATPIVRRSLITLKGLTYLPTGGMVAALTTSLPEEIGGARNWDYRYCWVRDATFTLLAFMNAGYIEEAECWRDWLLRAIAGSPEQLQIMYGIAGERRLDEWQIPWLPGYRNSAPVRIGNAASTQVQLDVFGEMMDALAQAAHGGMKPSARAIISRDLLLAHLENIWDKPDEGIWEIRGPAQNFTHSKAMAWLAFRRGADSTELRDAKLRGHYRRMADTIHADICKHGVDPTGSYFVQYYGATEVDASLLLLSIVGFLPPDDPRIRATVERIEQQLMVDGLVIRYRTKSRVDGLSGAEGAFLACSFWLVDNFVLLGRLDDAQTLFNKLTSFVNDVGLLSEEYNPNTGRMLGNFPQAFSHVALVNSAIGLNRATQIADKPRLSVAERRRVQKTLYRHAVHPNGASSAAVKRK
jgi:GH15 family glucan-1,4-alpha-glucosidase